MNKKNYIQPSTEITLVALQQMVCVSGPKVSEEPTYNEDDLLSRELRHSSIWDDDED